MRTPAAIAGLAAAFLAAAAAANLIIAEHGPAAAPYVALALIGPDLVLRDALHDRTRGHARIIVLAGVVTGGALLAYLASADAGRVALASAAAFAAAMAVDALVYHAARRAAWLDRVNRSNAASAAVDTAVFYLVAGFGLAGPAVIQYGMKVAGGLLVALALARLIRTPHVAPA